MSYRPPRLIFWELTKRCNLTCQHCRAVPATQAVPGELTSEEALGFLADLSGYAKPLIIFTGGEPLARPDLFALADFARLMGFRIALATNGTMITQEIAHRIRETGFERVAISLDGAHPETHDAFRRQPTAFARAMRGAREVRGAGIPLQINTTATQHNIHEIPQIYALAKSLGAVAFHLFLLVPVGCGLEIEEKEQLNAGQYEVLLEWLLEREKEGGMEIRATCAPHYYRIKEQRGMPVHGKGCLAGTGVCFLSNRGDIQGCGYLPVAAGNVLRQSFREIWEEAPLFQSLRDLENLQGRCGRCGFREVCSGCRARAYGMYGNYLAEEPLCQYEPSTHVSVVSL